MYSASQHAVIDTPPLEVFKVVGGCYTLSDWHPLCEDPPKSSIANEDGSVEAVNNFYRVGLDAAKELIEGRKRD